MAWHFMKQQQIPLKNSCRNGLMIHSLLSKPNQTKPYDNRQSPKTKN